MADEEVSETVEAEGLSIDEATRDDSVSGGELVPVSDAGSPKSMSVAQIKDFVISQIAGLSAASSVSLDNDKVYLLQGGELKPLTASTLGAAVMNAAFGRTAVASINGNEVFAVKDANDRKTITVAALADWLEDNLTIEADLNIISLEDASAPLSPTANYLVIEQGNSDEPDNRKIAIADFSAWCLARFGAFVGDLAAVQSLADADVLYVVQGNVAKKATVAQLKAAVNAGDVKGPATTTANNIPQWTSTTKKLKDGLSVAGTIRPSATASSTAIPTELAVRNCVDDALAANLVIGPETTSHLQIPQWDTTARKLTNGLTLETNLSYTISNDSSVPSAKAVKTAIANATNGVAKKSGTPTTNYLAKWTANGELTEAVPVVTAINSGGSNNAVPTTAAVANAIAAAQNNVAKMHIGASVPVDNTAGYDQAAFFFDTTTSKLYINVGNSAGCDFDEIAIGGAS